MRIDILTLFPEMFTGVFGCSIISRAVKGNYLELHTHDIRDYSTDKHRRVDDYPFGGGAGMVMMVEPIARCIEKLKGERHYDLVLFMAPDGKTFDQNYAYRLSLCENIMILCGHYKGVDERVRELFVDEEVIPVLRTFAPTIFFYGFCNVREYCFIYVRVYPNELQNKFVPKQKS